MRGSAQLPLSRSLLRADPVDRAAVRDRRHPRHRAAPARLKPRRAAPHLQQHLLAHLLRLKRIPHHAADDAEHHRPGARAHRLERGLISAGHTAQQGLHAAAGRLPGVGAMDWPRSRVAYPHTTYSPPRAIPVARPAEIPLAAIQNGAGGEYLP